MHEGFLEALLNDVFGILAAASNSVSQTENPYLLALDEFFKGSVGPTFCLGDQFFFVALIGTFISAKR
jgi:hypothetical protein